MFATWLVVAIDFSSIVSATSVVSVVMIVIVIVGPQFFFDVVFQIEKVEDFCDHVNNVLSLCEFVAASPKEIETSGLSLFDATSSAISMIKKSWAEKRIAPNIH